MGSTRVSEVAGIMSIGQGGQTLTGTKEGDLKVQFAEVMSQMRLQLWWTEQQTGCGSCNRKQ